MRTRWHPSIHYSRHHLKCRLRIIQRGGWMVRPHSWECSWDIARLRQDRTMCKEMYVTLNLNISRREFLSIFQFATFIPSNNTKHYFNVSNSYVIRKLQLLLFPWRHKTYLRRPRGQGEYFPPREDINSPDLYIPG